MPEQVTALTVLDVGHGNCAVITSPHGIFVIDAGGRNGLLEHLTQSGITKIDSLLISHADEDHISGLLALLSSEEIEIADVRLNSDAVKGSKIWDDVLWELKESQLTSKVNVQPSLSYNDSQSFDFGDLKLEVLAPSTYLAGKGPGSTDREGRKIGPNTISAVIRIIKDGIPVALLTGDLDSVGLAHLEESGVDTAAQLLVFPHHGGKPGTADPVSFTKMLCKMIAPTTIIFSIGRQKYQNPIPEVVEAIKSVNNETRIACTQLSVRCATSLPSEEAKHLLPTFASGRECNRCCGGSFYVVLQESVHALPGYDEHWQFIESSVPFALCRSK